MNAAREFFTSRVDGNLALHVGDDPFIVERNRERLANNLNLPKISVKYMNQVHGSDVKRVGIESEVVTADGIYTTERNIALVVLVADCIPILISSDQVIGAIHVGRNGLVKEVIENMVTTIRAISSSQLKATIGPAICGQCYQVSPDMYQDVTRQIPECATSAVLPTLDLIKGAVSKLLKLGVEVNNQTKCTLENSEFFSYRQDPITGRQAGVISW